MLKDLLPQRIFAAVSRWTGVGQSLDTWVGHVDPNVLCEHDEAKKYEDTAIMTSSKTVTNVTEHLSNT